MGAYYGSEQVRAYAWHSGKPSGIGQAILDVLEREHREGWPDGAVSLGELAAEFAWFADEPTLAGEIDRLVDEDLVMPTADGRFEFIDHRFHRVEAP